MNVFHEYARYYDSLYGDKDYEGECRFIRKVFEHYASNPIKSVLDLGCGTGSHAIALSEKGYQVTGVDRSEKMLRVAQDKAQKRNRSIRLLQSDIQFLDTGATYDAVIAMFNVLGYLTTNQEIDNTMKSVHKHLNPGGLFIADVWFGPAVLAERPTERIKRISGRSGEIVRHARPILDILNQTIQVNYTVSEAREGKVISEAKESHLVRFFFYRELEYTLGRNSFELVKVCPFLDLDQPLDEHCWNISVIARALT